MRQSGEHCKHCLSPHANAQRQDGGEPASAEAAETADGRRLPYDWLVTIGPDGRGSAERGASRSGQTLPYPSNGDRDGRGGRSGGSGAMGSEAGLPPPPGALRGGFLSDENPETDPKPLNGTTAGSRDCCDGAAAASSGDGMQHGRAADPLGGQVTDGDGSEGGSGRPDRHSELHPEVAATLDAALAQIGAAREALGEGPALGGVSAGRIQSGAPRLPALPTWGATVLQ